MKEFKINAQTHIIDEICEALECSHIGFAVKDCWTIERKNFGYGSTLYFTLKEGKLVQPDVLFWFGYFSARE
jgi:hypothetical protein